MQDRVHNRAQDNHSREIVIVRRRRDLDGEDAKNTVWKIAYADFMTAMMAFFLVMWLINVTDQETREIVASYFNPIRLAEATTDRKGLRDPDSSSSGNESDEHSRAIPLRGAAEGAQDGVSDRDRPRFPESALFQDPYAILAELAAELENDRPPNAMTDLSPGAAGQPGLPGGEQFRDPFDPVYWQVAPTARIGRSDGDGTGGVADAGAAFPEFAAGGTAARDIEAMIADGASDGVLRDAQAFSETGTQTRTIEKALVKTVAAEDGSVKDGSVEDGLVAIVSAQGAAPPEPETGPSDRPNPAIADAAEIQRRIATGIENSRGRFSEIPPVAVAATSEGILISLTDSARFGMFAIGSAEPKPEVVGVLASVAEILAEREGSIVIRGHTDARPFRSRDYDNWRLSTARAHMAYYMLVRGGFDESRIERVEGYADRMLKVPEDPEAAENRRIEILLREAGA